MRKSSWKRAIYLLDQRSLYKPVFRSQSACQSSIIQLSSHFLPVNAVVRLPSSVTLREKYTIWKNCRPVWTFFASLKLIEDRPTAETTKLFARKQPITLHAHLPDGHYAGWEILAENKKVDLLMQWTDSETKIIEYAVDGVREGGEKNVRIIARLTLHQYWNSSQLHSNFEEKKCEEAQRAIDLGAR